MLENSHQISKHGGHISITKFRYLMIFQAMDENSELISKKAFLQKLTTGKFIVISVTGDNRTYMLNEFTPSEDKSITRTIIDQAKRALHFYQSEGPPFPDFKAQNLDDQQITNKYFKGKTTILKTWFISCKPCIAEMPELNKLVDKYSNTDIQFLSLALDKKEALLDFLEKTEFKYDVLPNQKNLILNDLNLSLFPTHIVVDQNGRIKKVFNSASQIMEFLDHSNSLTSKASENKRSSTSAQKYF